MYKILVAGGGGFIGGHLVERLYNEGRDVVAVDIKPLKDWSYVQRKRVYGDSRINAGSIQNLVLDLKDYQSCIDAVNGCDFVFNLAADMGGMGFIETHKADCMLSVLINTNLLRASVKCGVSKFLYASSACAYAADKQLECDVTALKEEDAYPAMPEDGYGWEKLFSERMCRHFMEDYGLQVAIPRFHNVYGTRTHYDGGREKAPAALSRKVAEASLSGGGSISIWGDGEQTRSFMHVNDCVEGIHRLMFNSDFSDPINLGSSELVSINDMVSILEDKAGVSLDRVYDLSAPQGVRGRNSDNTLIKKVLGWEPGISLVDGLSELYDWVFERLSNG